MAWIIGTMYDNGRIARVLNPQDIPAGTKDGIWTGGIADEFGRRAVQGSEPVKFSRAKEIPRAWLGRQPGWRGAEVRYDAESGYFIDVVEKEDHYDSDGYFVGRW